MPTVTMSVDENLLKQARKLAVEQDTTLSEMFRKFLAEIVERDAARREFLADELDRLFEQSSARSGGIRISRDQLHER